MKILRPISILLTGISVGWLIGLSNSPVIASVIAMLLTLLVTLVTVISGLKIGDNIDPGQRKGILALLSDSTNPIPIMMLVVGIAVGAGTGLYVRNFKLLAPIPKTYAQLAIPDSIITSLVEKYSKYGIPRDTIAKRIFNLELPLKAENPFRIMEKPLESKDLGLMGDQKHSCEKICNATQSNISTVIKDFRDREDSTTLEIINELGAFNIDEIWNRYKKACECI